MAERTLISEMKPNQWVEGAFAIQNCQLGQTKAGKPFLKCLLADKSGRTPGRMWNVSEDLISGLPTDGFVWVAGQSQPYQGQLQIIIQQIEPVDPAEVNMSDLLPSTQFDPEQMFADVVAILEAVKHPALAALVRAYLDDEALMKRFKQAPAAATVHHAFLGGLLEHTLSLMRLGGSMCDQYPQLNREIVLVGLFVHDLGKCDELHWTRGFGYTDRGQLVGHIAQGVLWLKEKADQCAANGQTVPQSIVNVLQHIILSHHGRPEFGAVMLPATPEAIAVSLLDNLDAKMQLAISSARSGPGADGGDDQLQGHFTEKIWALETRLYRPDPTTVPDA